MATIKGVWVFKDSGTITAPTETITETVNYTTADGTVRTSIEIKDYEDTWPVLLNLDGWTVAIYNGETEFLWVEADETYKTVDFGETEQTVSDEFYAIMKQVAAKQFTISEKLMEIAENEKKVYDAGYTAGQAEGGTDELFKGVVEGTLSGEIVDNTITALRASAFYGCNKVTSLTLNKLGYVNQNGSGHFQKMTALETLNLPLATAIGYASCNGCSSLKNVYAPNAGIGYNTFGGCTSLEITDFPKCNYINAYTYSGCNNLKIVILRHNGVATLDNVNAFNNTPFRNGEGGTIYVPQAQIEKYETATNWNALESVTFLPIEGSEYE